MFFIRPLPSKYSALPGGVDCVEHRGWPAAGCCLFRAGRTSAVTLVSSSSAVHPRVSVEEMTILSNSSTGTESLSSRLPSLPGFEMLISLAVAPSDFFFNFGADPQTPLGGILLMDARQLDMR